MNAFFRPTAYFRPKDPAEAVSLLAAHGRGARILAGGTDLLVQRPPAAEILVDIGSAGLSYVKGDETSGFAIGAATPVEALERVRAFARGPYRALAEAVDGMATPTVRNRATVGGNLCNASPAADLAVALAAMGATVVVAGTGDGKEVPVEDFITGPNATVLREGELVTEIRIPPLPDGTGTGFCKLRRHQTSVDTAVVSVASLLQIRDGRCVDAAVSMGAVGPRPLRARRAEALLIGETLDGERIGQAARTAMEESAPIDDIRASAGYRKRMVAVLARNSLEKSLRRCSA